MHMYIDMYWLEQYHNNIHKTRRLASFFLSFFSRICLVFGGRKSWLAS